MSERKMNVSDSGSKRLVYPSSVVGDQVDSYHGVRVADPYRWLENDVRDSGAVRAWVTAQNDLTGESLGSGDLYYPKWVYRSQKFDGDCGDPIEAGPVRGLFPFRR